MSDDNQTPDPIIPEETPVSEETTISPTPDPSLPPTDSQLSDMPSEAPEAPADAFTPPPVNNDNPQPITPEPQSPESSNPPQEAVITASPSFLSNLLTKARETIQFRKRKKLDKIMELLSKKSKISNNDVTLLPRVSNATATRYLNILEQEGKIQQTGKTGHSVFYSKI